MEEFGRETRISYDQVAQEYANRFFDELGHKPFDRQLLDTFADRVRRRGAVADIGCGPGQVARYLRDVGVDTLGVDLSGRLLDEARRLNPDIPFVQGDMLALPLADESLAGLTAFYSIIHLHRSRVADALREMYRVLTPGGWLLLAFHGGAGELHNTEFLGKPVSFDASFFAGDEIARMLAGCGFAAPQVQPRDPYPFEYPSQRIYMMAQKTDP